ncbi:MAG: hypothetical protein EOP46_16760 [Sphingobacteriaceae bacterium]|nr:MAG: hypothetical protein EOP46_16760 [Sphingobacteriaceae bacterium]
MIRGLYFTIIALLFTGSLHAQGVIFRRDTTGGFKGVYCIGPLDLTKGPLIIRDDVSIDSTELKHMDRSRIYSIRVIKDSLATLLYGKAAEKGAIIVTTTKKKKVGK